jgi:uncharacterized protein involved in type VI secretion and phage assembly
MADTNHGSYLGGVKLKINGKDVTKELIEDILHLSVEESLHLPGMFTLVVKNEVQPRNPESQWKHIKILEIGSEVEVFFVSSKNVHGDGQGEDKPILIGEITSIETNFTEGSQAPIIVRGYDVSHRLHQGRHNRSFQNMTDADIVKKIASEAGLSIEKIDESGAPHEYIFQENQTNMEFLRERAARLGFELFVRNGKLFFRKPDVQGESIRLKWLVDLSSFHVRVATSQQVQRVDVRGWDYTKKQAILGSKKGGTSHILTTTDYQAGHKMAGIAHNHSSKPILSIVDQPVYSQDEAQRIAEAVFDEIEGQFVHADASSEGNPAIRAGCRIELNDMGKYDGKYYVTETRHVYSERHYKTEFAIRGLRGSDLLTTLIPAVKLQPGQTFLIGIVTNNQDPKNLGRVRVKFPTLTDEHESHWARIVTSGAGHNRGFDCLPEVNDEVLVGFEHGDIHRPFVIGNLWNGVDAPPEKSSDSVGSSGVRLRTIKTRTGHSLQFVEEDKGGSKSGVHLKTSGSHEFYLNDSDQYVEVKTKGGHSIRLDDNSANITLKSSLGHSITLNDRSQSISIKSQGSISIDAMTTLSISANGIVTINGAIIKLN